jgi:eukaryotic-like serine/threonine-protein kinase
MQTASVSATSIDRSELPSMLATLCSYESWLGPYHPQTLRLMAQVAIGYWRAGEPGHARPLLERVVRDMGRYLGRDHDLRLRAIAALRDLLVAQRDYERAAAVQHELLECQVQRLGSDHPETLAARDDLAMILLKNMPAL